MRAGGRYRERDAERCEVGARWRDQAADLGSVDADLDRLHQRGPPRRLERERIAPSIQGERLCDAAGTLDERGLGAVGCCCCAPSAAITLDTAR